LPEKNRFNLINTEDRKIISSEEDVYTFYTIGELNARKGIDDLIRAYCETFTNNDKVRLIIKTHYRDYNKINKAKCKNMLLDYLKPYPNHPPIICFMDNMTSSDILALHSIGDCYIALTKSEGFGLTIFDAYNYNKKIITTGYGGHIDFLGNDYAGLVKYSIGPVEGMESTNYTNDQLWAYPDIEHAKELMKLYYENYKPK
jgi:glycosyltransferase involved in cell wall biosynthesis